MPVLSTLKSLEENHRNNQKNFVSLDTDENMHGIQREQYRNRRTKKYAISPIMVPSLSKKSTKIDLKTKGSPSPA